MEETKGSTGEGLPPLVEDYTLQDDEYSLFDAVGFAGTLSVLGDLAEAHSKIADMTEAAAADAPEAAEAGKAGGKEKGDGNQKKQKKKEVVQTVPRYCPRCNCTNLNYANNSAGCRACDSVLAAAKRDQKTPD